MNPTFMNEAYTYWTSGKSLEAGRLLYELIPNDERPRWAAAILDLCRGLIPPVPEIDVISEIAADRSRWMEAHASFWPVRDLTLEAEGSESAHPVYWKILYVTENAAKVIYNASGEPAPFDEDAGRWLVSCLRRVVDEVGDPAFEARAWSIVSGAM